MSVVEFPAPRQQQLQAKYICSACGADRGCNCSAPAVEKLAAKQEQDRQRAKEYRARKAEENQPTRHVMGFDKLCAEAAGVETQDDGDEQPDVGGVEDPAKVVTNVLDSIKQAKAVAEAYRKILKVSPFDPEARKKISDEIELLIRKWRSVQSTLAAKDEPPPGGPGGGSEPKIEAWRASTSLSCALSAATTRAAAKSAARSTCIERDFHGVSDADFRSENPATIEQIKQKDLKEMLQKNIQAEGLLRTLTALIGSGTVIHLVDGLRCPRCKTDIHNDAELTDDGWRLLCRGCHTDILTVEGGEVS